MTNNDPLDTIFAAAISAWRRRHRAQDAASQVWSDLARRRFGIYVESIRPDATEAEREEGLPGIAELAIAETAIGWARAGRSRGGKK